MWVSDPPKAFNIVRAISDDYARRIIFTLLLGPKPVEEISERENIPISTCYRRVRELQQSGIVKPYRTVLESEGKKLIIYKCAFKSLTVRMEPDGLAVDVIPDNDAADKLTALWSLVRKEANPNQVKEKQEGSEVPLIVPPITS